MNLLLLNDSFLSTGIFGTLFSPDKSLFLQTLQHAYPISVNPVSDSLNWQAKIPPGVYNCIRGTHTLEPTPTHPKPQPFETFSILGVTEPDGSKGKNLLFHVGNFNEDSIGCVLLGMSRGKDMVCNSAIAFNRFMTAQSGIDNFNLTVS